MSRLGLWQFSEGSDVRDRILERFPYQRPLTREARQELVFRLSIAASYEQFYQRRLANR